MSTAIRRTVLRPLVRSIAIVAVSGLIVVGVSGLLADGFGALLGKSFVSGDQPGVTYTPERCADLFEYDPEAATCEAAATAHHFDEVAQYRIVLGVLGLLAGIAALLLFPRFHEPYSQSALLEGFTAIVGLAVYGCAAGLLLAESLGQTAFGDTNGAGAYLSGGLVSLVLVAGYAVAFWRTIQPRLPLLT